MPLLRPLVLSFLLARSLVARDLPAADAETLKTAIAEAQPGDAIVMNDGVWNDLEIDFRANGTAEAPITLKAQTPGQVILSGQSTLQFVGHYLVADGLSFRSGYGKSDYVVSFRGDSDEEASDCRLTNSDIIAYNPPDGSSTKWVSLYGTRNRVDHCRFQGKSNQGSLLVVWLKINSEPNGHKIDWNYFGDRPLLGKNGGEIIRVGDSKTSMEISRTVVEHNLFENCDGEAEIVSNKSCENIYRHNTFLKSAGALTLRHGNRCLVEGNFFLGDGKQGTGGVRIIGEGHRVLNNYFANLAGEGFFSAIGFMAGIPNSPPNGYLQIKDAVVAFNTIVNCRSSLFLGVGFGSRNRTLPILNCLIANNVVVSPNHPLAIVTVKPVDTIWEGNFFHGSMDALAGKEGIQNVEPLLKRGEDGLWQPGEHSPVLGAAVGNFPTVQSDILGRPREESKDAGCFQQSSGAPQISRFSPLNINIVGPQWTKTVPPAKSPDKRL